ncbi:Hemerythrin HHE cation binding domain [Ceratobasidium sp. AG-Ba]|nr:Hemerythrin HHE cation binding domain [Ceratobasidium sp. AG-Ba]QRW12835.1 Hemerythrin HHE cation binding domain [Ceratobasidium sp. AG-Ba]
MSGATYPLIPTPPGDWRNSLYDLHAIRMASLHNILIRSFNSIIYHAPKVEDKEVPVFMKYCSTVVELIHEHHATEEDVVFPALEEKLGKGSMESNVTQHEDFMPKFDQWSELLKSILAGKTQYDADRFIRLMREGTDVLVIHLQDEIPTLDSNKLREYFTVSELEALEKRIEKKVQEQASPWDIPLFFVNGDLNYNSWFPPMPAPVVFIIRHVIMRMSSDMWKYGQSDKYVNLKDEFKAGYGIH